jgi:hypothetical protein
MQQIENHIKLVVELFQSDSIQFDKTINLRIDRDKETDEIIRNQLSTKLCRIKSFITILEITSLCKELARMAAYVF